LTKPAISTNLAAAQKKKIRRRASTFKITKEFISIDG
jgi:hypothetical protein